MKWVRCPRCRTVNDIDRYAMCDGCDGPLSGLPLLDATPAVPPARRQAERDMNVGRLVLVALGILSALAILVMVLARNEDGKLTLFLVALPLLGLFLWVAMARRIHASPSHLILKAILYTGSLVVAGFGAFIILFIICAASQ